MSRLGLISDTHMPARCRALPPALFDCLAGVDLILHAGDVGELWALDQLSRIAPVIAVHGNDETPEATAALPYLQTLMVAGHRLVLTHAHYPDRAEELASRTDDWRPHFDRRVGLARQHGAEIIIFGHLHIPMSLQRNGVHLINPGGIASGNPWMRQLRQTVAILTLEMGNVPQATHYDLSDGQVHQPIFDPAGFSATMAHYNAVILEDDLYTVREWLWHTLGSTSEAVHETILNVGHTRWEGAQTGLISARELAEAFLRAGLPDESMRLLAGHPLFAPYC